MHGGQLTAAATTDSRAPLFYLSYARSAVAGRAGRTHTRDDHVERFFDDLSEDISQLVSRPLGADLGFLDKSMRGGQSWSSELLHTIGTCQVFIALLSGPYLASSWCSMEWDAFSRRTVINKQAVKTRSAIVPVIWAPYPEEITPSAVSSILPFLPRNVRDLDIATDYKHEGVYGLMRTNRDDSYNVTVWQLARHIATLYHSQSVSQQTFKPDDLQDVFAESRQ